MNKVDQLRENPTKEASQTKLLQQLVRMGNVDLVIQAMDTGASPLARGENGKTALEVAEEMCSKHPEERERKLVMETIKAEVNSAWRKSAWFAETIGSIAAREVISKMDDIKTTLSIELAAIRDTNDKAQKELKESLAEMESSTDQALKELRNATATKMSLLRTEVSYLKANVNGMDATLKVLEKDKKNGIFLNELKKCLSQLESSTKQKFKDLRNEMATTVAELNKDVEQLKINVNGMVPTLTLLDEGTFRHRCIEEMMKKTDILPKDEESASRMKRLYERMYDMDAILSCLLQYVHFQKINIFIDFESGNIGRLISKFTNEYNQERSGKDYGSFTSYSDRKGYVSGKRDENHTTAHLALILCKFAINIAFDNGGRPYMKYGDEESEKRMKEIIAEAERKKGAGEELDSRIRDWALNEKNEGRQNKKEGYMCAAIPRIIAYEGSLEGRSLLKKQLPSLLEFFEDHVSTTLRNETKKEISRAGGWM